MKKFLLGLSTVVLPGIALAQNVDTVANNAENTLSRLTDVINAVIPFLLAIAVVVFIYGVIRYVVASGPEEKAAGRSYIIWGIIGIAVILSIFGLVKLLQSSLGLSGVTSPGPLPFVPS